MTEEEKPHATRPPSRAQLAALAGFWPRTRTAREMVFRALVDRGLIDPMTGFRTEAGNAALTKTEGHQ